SHVPTIGRCPFTPSVVHNVGTRGNRASSWLSKTHGLACAFFSCGQFLPGDLLLLGLTPHIPLCRPIGPYSMALAEDPHGGAPDLNTCHLIEMSREFFIGPVGPIEAAALRPLLHPPLDHRAHVSGIRPGWPGAQRMGKPSTPCS